MSIMWSDLHAELGIGPGPLEYHHIKDAVDRQIQETAGLDWKAEHPGRDEKARAGLAKDVAAMANSGGGLLVLGVGETGSGAAKKLHLTPVELSAQIEDQVLALTHARVRPLVTGIEVELVPDPCAPSDPAHGAVLISIPASPDAPHFYEHGDVVESPPWRNGPSTVKMREREVERQYRARFQAAADAGARLDAMEQSGKYRARNWEAGGMVVAAVPVVGSAAPTSPDVAVVESTLRATTGLVDRIAFPTPDPDARRTTLLPMNVTAPDVTRRGRRRWRVGGPARGAYGSPYLELHHDGAVELVAPFKVDCDVELGSFTLHRIELAALHAIALPLTWARRRGLNASVSVRLTLTNPPVVTMDLTRMNPQTRTGLELIGTESLGEVTPVETTIDTSWADDLVRAEATTMALDIVHEFGGDALDLLVAR